MFLFLLTFAVVAVWIYQLVISSRLRSAREQHEEELRRLVRRVWVLENAAAAHAEPPAPEPALPPLSEPAAAIADVPAPAIQSVQPPEPEPPPAPPVRERTPSQGWEAILGGNWLNKIGVLLLVVGLVLFIRYSFGMLGPAGRVAVSLAVSASMLTAGVALERNEKYRVAARGLIGGG